MKNLLPVIILFLGLSRSFSVFAQTIRFDTAQVSKELKQIYIPYSIVESPKEAGKFLYNITLRYSQDQGKTYSDSLQNVSLVGLDVGEALLPGNKTITWNYYDEIPSFDGQDVWFKLDVDAIPNPFALKGPESALYSLALPGWGNTKVNPKAKFWYVNTIASLGLIATGAVFMANSNRTYDKYLNAETFDETQRFFDRSNNQQRTGIILMLGGAAVWLTDIARVYFKGLRNRKLQRKFLDKYPHLKKKYSLNYGLDYNYQYRQPSFSVGLKF